MLNKKFDFIIKNCKQNNVVVINAEVITTLFTMDTNYKNINKDEKELLDAFSNGLENFLKENKGKKYVYIIIYNDVNNKYQCLYCQDYTTDNFKLVNKIIKKKEKIKVYKNIA